jgi:hypothetical protein
VVGRDFAADENPGVSAAGPTSSGTESRAIAKGLTEK